MRFGQAVDRRGQAVRRRRTTATADGLGVSVRTVYRNVATLRGEGASIADPDGHRLRVFAPTGI